MIEITNCGNMIFDRVIVENFKPFSFTVDGEKVLVAPQKNHYADFKLDHAVGGITTDEYLRGAVLGGQKNIAKPWNNEKYTILINYVGGAFRQFREFYKVAIEVACIHIIYMRCREAINARMDRRPWRSSYLGAFRPKPGFWSLANELQQNAPSFPETAARFKGVYSLPHLQRIYSLEKMSSELHLEKINQKLSEAQKEHHDLMENDGVRNVDNANDFWYKVTVLGFPDRIFFNYLVRRFAPDWSLEGADKEFMDDFIKFQTTQFGTYKELVLNYVIAFLRFKERCYKKGNYKVDLKTLTECAPVKKLVKEDPFVLPGDDFLKEIVEAKAKVENEPADTTNTSDTETDASAENESDKDKPESTSEPNGSDEPKTIPDGESSAK